MSRLLSRRRLLAGSSLAAVAGAAPRPGAARVTSAGDLGGPLVTLRSPVRAFDSRTTPASLGGGRLVAGQSVGVTLSAAFAAGDADAVLVNVTITQTLGSGYLVVRGSDLSGLQPLPATSNVNWWTSGLTLANLTLTKVGGENTIEVHCEGNGSTHVVVDVQGYVPPA